MKPIIRYSRAASVQHECEWCGEPIFVKQRHAALVYSEDGVLATRRWHFECEQAHLDAGVGNYTPGKNRRPAYAIDIDSDAPSVDDGGTNPVLGLAFGVAMSAFLAVLIHGAWKFAQAVL